MTSSPDEHRSSTRDLTADVDLINRTAELLFDTFRGRAEDWQDLDSARKFAQLLVDGKISAQTYEEWNRETGSTLPDHVRKRKPIATKKKTKKKKSASKKR